MSTLNVTTIIPDVGTDTNLSLDGKGTGDVAIVADATVGGAIAVTGAATLSSTLGVTGASTLAALTASGTPTFSSTDNMSVGGNLLLTTAAKGVYLGVTSATAANLLDDYEEGTWSPQWVSSSATFTHATQVGTYVKVGRFVYLEYRLALGGSPGGTTSNATFLYTLPFTAKTVSNLYFGGHVGHFYQINLDSGEQAGLAWQMGSAGTTLELKGIGDNQGEQGITPSQMNSNFEVRGSFAYITA